jgi:hypothetical protein
MSELFLGAIALATTVMAVLQIGMAIAGARLARRVDRLFDQVEREIVPVLGRLQAVSADVSRVTALAVAQVERADQIFAQAGQRLDHLLTLAQDAVVAPARQGLALLAGLRAGLAALRCLRQTRRGAGGLAEDEEALFIG